MLVCDDDTKKEREVTREDHDVIIPESPKSHRNQDNPTIQHPSYREPGLVPHQSSQTSGQCSSQTWIPGKKKLHRKLSGQPEGTGRRNQTFSDQKQQEIAPRAVKSIRSQENPPIQPSDLNLHQRGMYESTSLTMAVGGGTISDEHAASLTAKCYDPSGPPALGPL